MPLRKKLHEFITFLLPITAMAVPHTSKVQFVIAISPPAPRIPIPAVVINTLLIEAPATLLASITAVVGLPPSVAK